MHATRQGSALSMHLDAHGSSQLEGMCSKPPTASGSAHNGTPVPGYMLVMRLAACHLL